LGTKIAVTASKEERARARVKKEEILNIITIDENEYCFGYFKG
jgi:hypothetical protein